MPQRRRRTRRRQRTVHRKRDRRSRTGRKTDNKKTHHDMRDLNRIEIRGRVGRVTFKNIAGGQVANLSVATNHCYKDREGSPIIETTWHNVTAWGNEKNRIADLKKGDTVHVTGRLRQMRYTTSSGEDRTMTEIFAATLETVTNDNAE